MITGLTGLYTFATVTISLIFLSFYYFSGMVVCLLPVGLVLFDYIRTVRIARRQREVDVMERERAMIFTVVPDMYVATNRETEQLESICKYSPMKTSSDSRTKPFEFILEEEFKV